MPPVIDIDLELLRQLAGTAWLLFIALPLLVLVVLAVLLPLFVWRIWWWSRATCREIVRLNEKMEHLLTWLIAMRRISAGEAGAAGQFSFGQADESAGSTPSAGEADPIFGERPEDLSESVPLSEDAGEEEELDFRFRCSRCGGLLSTATGAEKRPTRCPACHAPFLTNQTGH